MALDERDLRKIINTKQASSEFQGSPSISNMLDGQIAIQKESNNQLAIYRKKFGRLWKSYMSSDGDEYVKRNLNVKGKTKSRVTAKDLIFEKGPELTIDEEVGRGYVTITHSFHQIDTESNASSDDLDTIYGGHNGQILILKPANGNRTVVIRHDEGNIITSDGSNFSMDDLNDTAIFFRDNDKWFLLLTISAE